jgi:hypothetical protein
MVSVFIRAVERHRGEQIRGGQSTPIDEALMFALAYATSQLTKTAR